LSLIPIRLQSAIGIQFQPVLLGLGDSPLLEPFGNRGNGLTQSCRKGCLGRGVEMLFHLIWGHFLLVYGIP
jgi:hypothetical protein